MKPSIKPVVFVDIDDTLADTVRHVLKHVNKEAPQQYEFSQLTRDFREGHNEGREYNTAVKKLLRPDIMTDIAPYPEAITALKRLHDAGCEVHIVSARQEPLYEMTLQWLERHRFVDFVEHVHSRPSAVKGKLFKHRLAERLKPVALFDDTLSVVLELVDVIDTAYLIDKPWNNGADVSLPPNVVRAADFATAVDMFLAT